MKLAQDINSIMNSMNISDEQIQHIANDAKDILEASGVTKADAQVIKQDLINIANKIKKNIPKP